MTTTTDRLLLACLLLAAALLCGCGASSTETLEERMAVPPDAPEHTVRISVSVFHNSAPEICLDAYEVKGDLTCLTRRGVTDCIASKYIQTINQYRLGTRCLDGLPGVAP